jgi:antirestriction protein ArdC
MKTDRVDIHQHITDKIVSAIERGAGDFRLPWHRSAGNIMRPVNVASKKAYRGINVVALWAYAEEFGYSSGVWALTGNGPRPVRKSARARKPPSSSSIRSSRSPPTLRPVTPSRQPAFSRVPRRSSPPSK